MNTQPQLRWRDMDGAEQSIWACAFATGNADDAHERARHADAAVHLFHYLPDRHPSANAVAFEVVC